MASYTRQQILERFSKVETNKYKVSLPCFVNKPVEPEAEDFSVDFELILKELGEQEAKKREYQERKKTKITRNK